MKPHFINKSITYILCALLLTPFMVHAERGDDRRQDRREQSRQDDRRYEYKDKRRVVLPRHRSFKHIVIVRRHGHSYHGYGHFIHDNDAYKWLAFTAITLKILDMISEEAQRKHESAQVSATKAPIGEAINWEEGSSSGSVVATKQGINSQGLTCREFQQTITVGGKTEDAYGTACLQEDGAWKITSE